MKHVVCSLDELPPGQMRSVIVERVAIVVARTPEGDVHALRDACSHYGARLSRGTLRPMVLGTDVGEYQEASGRYVIRCPWHGYEFEITSGRCPADAEHERVRVYPVTVDNGTIVVER